MFDEPFAWGKSFIHKLDPRIRLFCAGFAITGIAFLQHRSTAMSALSLALFLFLLSKPGLKFAFKRLVTLNFFILFLWVTVPLNYPGESLVHIGPISVSKQGVELVELLTLKSNAMAVLFLTLAATMNAATLGKALSGMYCPDKLVFLLLFTYRYIHVALDEWQKLRIAAKLRAFTPKSSLRGYRVLANMLWMTFVQSFERSERVYEAMLLRGFSGRFLSAAKFKAGIRDIVFLVALVIIVVMICVADWRAAI
jgi:cobalt/nickel transport system permease protein